MTNAEVAIVGAGPAGIAAAVRAAECGADVVAIDDNPTIGGQIWRGRSVAGASWFEKLDRCGAKVLTGSRVFTGDTKRRVLQVESANAAFEIRYEKLILATGARELFLPFPGWTLPNVMGAGGLQGLVKGGLPIAGKRVVVAGSGPLLLAVAAYLRDRGAIVPVIVEQAYRSRVLRFAVELCGHPAKLWQSLRLRAALASSAYWTGAWVERAEGEGKLSSVQIRWGAGAETMACDYLAIGYGLCPNTELARYLGVTGLDGSGGVDLALIEGQIAGYEAAGRSDLASGLFPGRATARSFAEALSRTFALRAELRTLPDDETIVCRCEDVRFGQLKKANSWRSAKLHWRCGMGPCQGRVCGPAVQFLFDWEVASVRPPVFPARVGSLISEGAAK